MKKRKYIGLIIFCFTNWQASAGTVSVSGLVAKYAFNGNGLDSSGNNYHSTPSRDYSFIPGGGIKINGRNSDYSSGGGYVSIPISTMGLSLSQGFTLSFQMSNAQQLHLDGEMFAFWGNESNGQYIFCVGSGYYTPNNVTFSHYLRGGTSNPPDISTTVANEISTLHTYTMTQSSNTFSAYLDGTFIGSTMNILPFPSSSNLYLGRHDWLGGSHSERLNANFYDVQIYNRALSATEVQSIVPEPSSLYLLLAGGAVLMTGRRIARIRGDDQDLV